MNQKKVVALIEKTGTYKGGVNFEKSFNYLWTLSPTFVTFEIVDIANNSTLCLSKLNEYYLQGYRIFFGPLSSSNLNDCLSWFQSHPDAFCVTPVSNAIVLSQAKPNIYRLQPSDFYAVDYVKTENPTSTRVFYLYNAEQLTCQNLLTKLGNSFTTVVPFAIAADGSNLTQQNITDYYTNNSITSNDTVIIFIINVAQFHTYLGYFETLSIPAVQYDLNSIGLPTIDLPANLQNKYISIFMESPNHSTLLAQAKEELGTSYASNSLTSLYLLTLLSKGQQIDLSHSYGEALPWFNEYNDIKYWSYSIYQYQSTGFTKQSVYLNDPVYGTVTFRSLP